MAAITLNGKQVSREIGRAFLDVNWRRSITKLVRLMACYCGDCNLRAITKGRTSRRSRRQHLKNVSTPSTHRGGRVMTRALDAACLSGCNVCVRFHRPTTDNARRSCPTAASERTKPGSVAGSARGQAGLVTDRSPRTPAVAEDNRIRRRM